MLNRVGVLQDLDDFFWWDTATWCLSTDYKSLAVSGLFIFLLVLHIDNHLFGMEMDNVTIVPPKTPEHKYPVVSIGPVPLRQEVVDKLIEFCRNNEMADI